MKNGEKFKTAGERAMAFQEYCDKNSCQNCFDDCMSHAVPCLLKWLDLEAEEEKPLPCPFCGKDVEIHTYGDYNTWNQAQCTCGYRGSWWSDKDKAIAAHNRVARAVMEAKKKGAEK